MKFDIAAMLCNY